MRQDCNRSGVQGSGLKVQGSKVQRFKGSGLKVQGSKVQRFKGSGLKVQGSTFRVTMTEQTA
jgi:hypothetical protein